jgi:hypothetical protein
VRTPGRFHLGPARAVVRAKVYIGGPHRVPDGIHTPAAFYYSPVDFAGKRAPVGQPSARQLVRQHVEEEGVWFVRNRQERRPAGPAPQRVHHDVAAHQFASIELTQRKVDQFQLSALGHEYVEPRMMRLP